MTTENQCVFCEDPREILRLPGYFVRFNDFPFCPLHSLLVADECWPQSEIRLADIQTILDLKQGLGSDFIAFFNVGEPGGPAGATQRHRHGQICPAEPLPIESAELGKQIFNDEPGGSTVALIEWPAFSLSVSGPQRVQLTYAITEVLNKLEVEFNLVVGSRECTYIIPRGKAHPDGALASCRFGSIEMCGRIYVPLQELIEEVAAGGIATRDVSTAIDSCGVSAAVAEKIELGVLAMSPVLQ